MEETLLQSKELYKSYNTGKTIVPVINGINLTLYKSDFTVIMGSSGSGKSTLLYLLSGLEVPSSGEIWLEDKPVHTLDEKMMT
ncbi:MAG: ATP-binding cassette domain-containing protein, partial [Saprospiraceae bacterium]|nr:ATP-binding cassette domain-containing protein [Saprospiraceae bacterium]